MFENIGVGTSGCSTFMASHSKIVSSQTSYWTNVVDDDYFSLQESYDQLVHENLKLKKNMIKINKKI